MSKRKCPQLYPGCDGCPYIRKGINRSLAKCPYYLGIDTYTPEQHHQHETIGKMFDDLKKFEESRFLK